jgi:hypothetical protein
MNIDKSKVLDLVRSTLTPEQIERSFIYWDKKVFEEGEKVRIGGPRTVIMPFDGTMVFVDLAPRLNWAHPCLYLLVNVGDLSTEIVKASFPPYSDQFPETFTIILKYGKAPFHERDFRIFDE